MPVLDTKPDLLKISCNESSCNRALYGQVAFCPFCGTATEASQAVIDTTTKPVSVRARSPRAPREPVVFAPVVTLEIAQVALQDLPANVEPQAQEQPAPIHADDDGNEPPPRPLKTAVKASVAPPHKAAVKSPELPAPQKKKKTNWIVPVIVVIGLLYMIGKRSSSTATPESVSPANTPIMSSNTVAAMKEGASVASPAIGQNNDAIDAKPAGNVPASLSIEEVLAPIPSGAAQTQLMAMLANARDGDMAAVMAARRPLQQLVLPVRGNRKIAREANDAGLSAKKANDFAEATRLFTSGVMADSADQEIVNNLGYSLYKQGRLPEARLATMAALTLSPERSAAWGTFGTILAELGDSDNAKSAFVLASKFSSNPGKTMELLKTLAQDDTAFQVRAAASNAINFLSQPLSNTTAPAPVASAPNAAPTIAPVRDNSSFVISMLEDGDACMASKKFDCAVTNAKAALRLDPQNMRARVMQRNAEAEQRKAMDSITIN